jgi:transmembrane sensor
MATGKQDHAARLEAAASWYAELQDESALPEDWQRFLAWERDPANAAAFREIEASLNLLDRTRLARGRAKRAAPGRPSVWAGAAAAAALLVAGAAFLVPAPPAPVPGTVYSTRIGEQRRIDLEDGSAVLLNTDTSIEVAFSGEARRVRLSQGQALFDVETGAVPFIVEAAGNQTTALGTEFEIFLRPEGLAVTLVEGSVRVAPMGQAGGDMLAPGQQLQVNQDGTRQMIDVDADAVTGWQGGMIQFADVTLAEAVEEMNRYSAVKLRIDDPQLSGERLSGVFRAGDQDLFAQALGQYLQAETERSGNEIRIRRAD